MARPGSLTEAGAELGEIGRELADELLARCLGAASYAIKLDALRIADAVSGGDRRLSRYGSARSRGRVKLGAGYELAPRSSTISLRPAALWVLTNGGARAHPIGLGRRTASGRFTRIRKGRRRLVIGGAVRTGPFKHPGARGRGAVAALYAAVPDICAEEFADVLNSRLTGR